MTLIQIGDTYTDNMQLLIVTRADKKEIEQLCKEFNVHFKTTEDL